MTNRNARHLLPKLLAPLAAASTLLAGTAAHAEVFGIMNGRPATAPAEEISVEAALQLGDDVRYISARGNYAVSPTMTAFANVGQGDFDESSFDGFQLGGGVFLHLDQQSFAPTLDFALKPSIGYGQFSAGNTDLDTITLAGEVLVSSPEPLGDTSVNWYANAGLAYLRRDTSVPGFSFDDDDIELIIGGGVTLPVGPGTLYAGVDFIDNLQFGGGYRFPIR